MRCTVSNTYLLWGLGNIIFTANTLWPAACTVRQDRVVSCYFTVVNVWVYVGWYVQFACRALWIFLPLWNETVHGLTSVWSRALQSGCFDTSCFFLARKYLILFEETWGEIRGFYWSDLSTLRVVKQSLTVCLLPAVCAFEAQYHQYRCHLFT